MTTAPQQIRRTNHTIRTLGGEPRWDTPAWQAAEDTGTWLIGYPGA